jgi:hypothetical protein
MRATRLTGWGGVALVLAGLGAGCSQNDEAKFVPLFDGKTTDGWTPYTAGGEKVAWEECSFSVQDGSLHCSGKGKDYWISTDRKYRDFVLKLEYKLTSGANSGVFLRVPGGGHPAFTGYEIQVIDDVGKPADKHTSASVYDVVAPKKNMSCPIGEWNEFTIKHQGSKVTIVFNGETVIDTDFAKLTEPVGKYDFAYADMPEEGYIGLQNHGGELWYRNVRIRVLE